MKRLTFRARLTLVYGCLFLVAGLVMLGITYLLVADRQTPSFNVGYTAAGPGDAGALVNQISESAWDEALSALLARGGIALAVVVVAATAFGWLLAGRLLRPLDKITDTAVRIADAPAADRGLHERIALTGPRDEVKRLADAFDTMLERLDHAFDGQRRFVANASHELRTPLTVNRSLLEVALYRGEPTPEFRQLGQTLLEVNTRHEQLLDGLLVLARSERAVTERSYVDVADIVDHVVSVTDFDGLDVRVATDEAAVSGNPPLLERLVQNLVDNAVRYNVPSGFVAVSCFSRDDAVLVVENSGPVIPKYDVPALFEPFHRGSRTSPQVPGAGLGLSIVQAIARAHGGDVRAESRTGGGLVVTVTLPPA
ncbi:MAG: HAMP domain-containing histidine kinase [Hamadaea sp.]|uniref:sensor histidine kinase n=1 Tax=Hamadaea sp. TaxID=2024425 RepID=UPI00180F7FDA|nr:HAMP domain-containing sensor histidine kinase [Hamadaea sp.]NUR72374.1 HAMP domain-containing histidine kinase [Hamadaea sp.]NUT24028.1 HAMP domain-containing histidine kinase [Hamadaea sp.]